ncbi:outer membrane autotransporter barrel domain-containing protein [Devosia limi DSM 17137]|uniref:Outer membrane autotransporter barrel domain-containing protein n=2 Tax=Devosia TaxID=46913 RepID=A0A1M5FTI4_9HYPH|nr:outer membrane autotransporter barrel domain-containing protein [Devosia limi DSM 17137]
MQGAAGAALAIGISVATATPAQAACTPGAVDAATPAPGTTVTCSGTTLDQNLDAGYGTANQTGITINVGNGATVESHARIGIWVGDGVINNGVGATILGWTNGIIAATGSLAVTNDGSITATNANAINAATGLTLTNHATGVISGGVSGIVSGGVVNVDNAGTITGTAGSGISSASAVTLTNQTGGNVSGVVAGISSSANVTLTNQAGGGVSGTGDGIKSLNGAVTVDNAGTITGTNEAAIDGLLDISVTNRAGGVISGGMRGIFSRGGNIILDNSGSITSSNQVATVSTQTGNVTLINRAGGSINGNVITGQGFIDVHNSGDIGGITGSTGIKVVNAETGTITSIVSAGDSEIDNFGTVTTFVGIVGTGNLVNHTGARILGSVNGLSGSNVVNHAGGYIGGAGVINGSIENSGTINGGVGLHDNARLVNNAGASITSATDAVSGASGAGSSISNAGTISATNYGIVFSNSGNTITNLAGGTMSGGAIGVLSTSDVSITNSGTISGTAAPGIGLLVGGALQLVNNAGASINGAVGGIVTGFAGGSASIVNAGSISGGTAAISFGAAGNTLTLLPGSVISGDVIGFGSDTLQLAGTGRGSVDISQFSGFTTFTKFDPSIWTLTGTATYASPVDINGGTLAVNGNLASAGLLTVNPGGTLGGSGIVGATTINGGTLAPGNSIGTLTMASLTMTPGSTYLVQVDGAASDRMIVTGAATIAGTVSVDPLARVTSTTTYTIIDAGTLTGTFDSATLINNFGRNARLSYAGDTVLLTLDPGLLVPGLVGNATFNQKSVAAGIDSAIVGGAVLPGSFDALFALSGDPLLDALSQFSGEIHASAKSALIEESRFVRDAINGRLRAAFDGAGASLAPVLAYGPGATPVLVAPDHGEPSFWSHGFGAWSQIDSDGNAARLDHSTGGLLIGADSLVGDWRIGLLAGYSRTGLRVADRASSGSSNNYHVGLYGGTEWGNIAFRSGLAYTWHDLSTNRSVTIPGLAESLSAGYGAGTLQAFGELGYGFDMGSTRFEPFANLAYVNLHNGNFAEQGGAVAVSGASSTTGVTFITLGLRAEHALALGTVDATLRGMVGWRHAFGDTTPMNSHAFSAGDAFAIAGTPMARDSAMSRPAST